MTATQPFAPTVKTYTKPVHFTAKCRCGAKHRFTGSVTKKRTEYVGAATGRSITRDAVSYSIEGRADVCACLRLIAWHEITAVTKPKVKCTARCTGSAGHVCECSCGGANHGKDA